MKEHCPHCMMLSIQNARERDNFHRMLAAMVDAAGGVIRIDDRNILANGGPEVPEIEIFQDIENRCTVIRRPLKSPLPVPSALRPSGPVLTIGSR